MANREGEVESAKVLVKFWQSLARKGSGNGDVAALTLVRDQIIQERAALAAAGQPDERLRIVLACSDGYPDNEAGVRQLAAELGALGVVVVGIGMTDTAARVPVIFHNPPHSYGDLARTIHDLPAIAAKHVIRESIKLFPAKSRRSAQRKIDVLIAKLSRIS